MKKHLISKKDIFDANGKIDITKDDKVTWDSKTGEAVVTNGYHPGNKVKLSKEQVANDFKDPYFVESPVNYDDVRLWAGDWITDSNVDVIVEALEEAHIAPNQYFRIKNFSSQEQESAYIWDRVNYLYSQIRPGMEPIGFDEAKTKDVLYGMIKAVQNGTAAKGKKIDEIEVGDTVEFINPEEDEVGVTYNVLELRGDRVLVNDNINTEMSPRPTYAYLLSDLKKVGKAERGIKTEKMENKYYYLPIGRIFKDSSGVRFQITGYGFNGLKIKRYSEVEKDTPETTLAYASIQELADEKKMTIENATFETWRDSRLLQAEIEDIQKSLRWEDSRNSYQAELEQAADTIDKLRAELAQVKQGQYALGGMAPSGKYYYLKIGNIIKEWDNSKYKITSHKPDGIGVTKVSNIEKDQKEHAMYFDKIPGYLQNKSIAIYAADEQLPFETDRDQELIRMEIENIRNLATWRESSKTYQAEIDYASDKLIKMNAELAQVKSEANALMEGLEKNKKGFKDSLDAMETLAKKKKVLTFDGITEEDIDRDYGKGAVNKSEKEYFKRLHKALLHFEKTPGSKFYVADKAATGKVVSDYDAKLEAFLAKFPDNTKSWGDATDEMRDLAREVREQYNGMIDAAEGDKGYVDAIDFRKINSPSEWNKKAKKQIRTLWKKLTEENKQSIINSHEGWF